MVFAIGKYELYFITVAIKWVLENLYFKYITGAKKIIKKTYTSAFKSASICHFKLYWFKTYTSTFENVGIGTAYVNAFKSAGIIILNYID